MGVKSDRWIKKMVEEYRMIEPFCPELVSDGKISYGLSSYGYDVRVDNKFKIFTNINSTIVDPKNFDNKSFVDVESDVCIIPPNSFALAKSVEYFRIPRNVIVICIGKSTYARCGIIVNVTPLEPCYDKDTEVLTKEGWKKFSELRGDETVATINRDGVLEYQPILKMQRFRFTGEMIQIKGRNIDLLVTPAHLMYVRNRYKEHFEFIPAEEIYGRYNYELKRDCLWNAPDVEYFELPPVEINGTEERGMRIKMDDWLSFFGLWLAEGSAYRGKEEYTVRIACFGEKKKTVREWLSNLPFPFIETDTGFTILNKQLAIYLMQFGKASERFIPQEVKELSSRQIRLFLSAFMSGDGDMETKTFTTSSKRLADDLQELILKAGWASIIRKISKERILKGGKVKYDIYKVRISKRHLTPKIYKNSFNKVPYDDYVYDVTVPNHTLYVRRNGKACWSSNCWEGYITLEISNTTPLPAKIYAYEGLAQLVFFEADEICEVSYADRKGKYNKQMDLTLPKV